MKRRIGGVALIGAIALPLTIGLGAAAAQDGTTRTESVALQGAESARVEFEMTAGDLELHGGAGETNLISGSFTYEDDDWQPEINYNVEGTRGDLSVEPEGDWSDFLQIWEDDRGASWDVSLNDTIPTNLEVQIDAGDLQLALGGTRVTSLEVDVRAAEAEVDLTGEWQDDFTADIDGEAADLTIRLPEDVGVRIEMDATASDLDTEGFIEDGDDAYINEAFGSSDVTLTIRIEADVSEVTLEQFA